MKKALLFLSVLTMAGCHTQKTAVRPVSVDGKLWASLFQQKAAEYKALCFQAYATARFRLDEALAQPHTKPLAVVTDIDETVLDNSPYAVRQSLAGKDYEPASWAAWTAEARADTLAGARAFFSYAESKGVEVFYITNRDEKERAATLENLRKYRFPFVDDAHLVLRSGESSKENRRKKVQERFEIALLLGDNLSDFNAVFDKVKDDPTPEDRRQKALDASAGLFGKKFIVLPNSAYGDWETVLYRYRNTLSPEEKNKIILESLKK